MHEPHDEEHSPDLKGGGVRVEATHAGRAAAAAALGRASAGGRVASWARPAPTLEEGGEGGGVCVRDLRVWGGRRLRHA